MVDRFRRGFPPRARFRFRDWRQEWYEPSPWEGQDGQTFYRGYAFARHCGGDLAGLRDALPYLRDLGVDALYLIPVFQAASAHKYDASSYVHIDERYGGGDDHAESEARESLLDPSTWTFNASDRFFLEFLRAAKQQGFRVILDGVFNHVGTRHAAFQDVKAKGRASVFADWFEIESWEPFAYRGWAGHGSLPQFRKCDVHGLASASLRQHIFDVTRRWLDPDGDGDPSDGIDGWRLDVPNEVPMAFWREWRAFVKQIQPEAYLTGEIWGKADTWVGPQAFDAVMNYEFAAPVVQWVFGRQDKLRAAAFDARMAKARAILPPESAYAMQNLLDSHDTDRAVSMAKNPDRVYNQRNREQDAPEYDGSKPGEAEYRRLRLAALVQMTYVGAPMIWYGTEAGMWGSSDPNNRKPMLWADHEPYAEPAENHVMHDLTAYYRRIIALRHAFPALRTGSFERLLADDERDVWAFVRRPRTGPDGRPEGGHEVLVVLNASDEPQRVTLPVSPGGWQEAFGEAPSGAAAAAFPAIDVAPVSGRVWSRAWSAGRA